MPKMLDDVERREPEPEVLRPQTRQASVPKTGPCFFEIARNRYLIFTAIVGVVALLFVFLFFFAPSCSRVEGASESGAEVAEDPYELMNESDDISQGEAVDEDAGEEATQDVQVGESGGISPYSPSKQVAIDEVNAFLPELEGIEDINERMSTFVSKIKESYMGEGSSGAVAGYWADNVNRNVHIYTSPDYTEEIIVDMVNLQVYAN